ncbi:lysozyme inhibitor LprI family protein [Burkholderia sp. Bp8963]|uniref:lysozyme inhibitor LprI family protein n=1 Tax=Burkholderia sp. Bp8963 TaxID=2184547 RepID=UPI00390837A5
MAAALLSACDKGSGGAVASSNPSPPQASSAPSVSPTSTAPAVQTVPAPPRHNYALNQDGTYGYEPALSEDDIRSGKAVKSLVMMRYVGLRNGTYVLLVLNDDNPNVTSRITCQAPCNFAKSEIMAGDSVVKTETLRVVPNSMIGAMLEDAMAGQLSPYGQQLPTMSQYANNTEPANVPSAAPSPDTAPQAAPVQVSASTSPAGAGALQQTSFDCGKAKSIPEYLICHDPDLAASDRDLAVAYQQAKDAVVDKAAFTERVRKQWNFREKNCHDKECLASWYAYQKRVLTKIAQTGDVSARDD